MASWCRSGLSVYGLDGHPSLHLFGSAQVSVTTADGLAYAWFSFLLPTHRVAVIDPTTGAVLDDRSTQILELLAPSS